MTLLDTHVLVWLRTGDARLGRKARSEIDRSLRADQLAVSGITFWELEMLNRRRRIKLDHPVGVWRRLLLREGLIEIPPDGAIAVRAAGLTGFHADPADRFIVATALTGHRLLTADRRILRWRGALSRLDAAL